MIVNRLPQLLSQKNMSIRELSRQTGVTYTTIWSIYHMQRRSVQFSILEAICRVLDVQPGDVYSYTSANLSSTLQEQVEKPLSPEPVGGIPRESLPDFSQDQLSNDWRTW